MELKRSTWTEKYILLILKGKVKTKFKNIWKKKQKFMIQLFLVSLTSSVTQIVLEEF